VNLDREAQDILIAAADIAGRAGATGFQIGYLSDDRPGTWYAYARFRGARITVQAQPGPAEAAEALARALLTGAKCRCGRLVALDDAGAVAFARPVMTDGTTWTAREAAQAGQCRWTRHGDRWVPGCPGGQATSGEGRPAPPPSATRGSSRARRGRRWRSTG
jgi:hypothetical protein